MDFSGTLPRGRRCALPADGEVCGIRVCSRHRDTVTTWVDGKETLREKRAAREVAAWGVTPTKPFEPLDF